jgi:hypothetical protein
MWEGIVSRCAVRTTQLKFLYRVREMLEKGAF